MSEEQRPVELISDLSVLVQRQLGESTSQIQYVSQGHCLIIGELSEALAAGRSFSDNGYTVVQIDPDASRIDKRLTDEGIAVFTVPALEAVSWLDVGANPPVRIDNSNTLLSLYWFRDHRERLRQMWR